MAKTNTVIFPILEQLFFSEEELELASRLKAMNDLRIYGLVFRMATLTVVFAICFASSFFMTYAMIVTGKREDLILIAYIFSILIFLFPFLFLFLARKSRVFMINNGELASGMITSVKDHRVAVDSSIDVTFIYRTHVGELAGKDSLSGVIYRNRMPVVGDEVYVFYETNQPSSAGLYEPRHFKFTCISQSMFDRMNGEGLFRGLSHGT